MPTDAEFIASNITNSVSAYGSVFKFVPAGSRHRDDAALSNASGFGFYWSSTVSGTNANIRYFYNSSTSSSASIRAIGDSVRCIKD